MILAGLRHSAAPGGWAKAMMLGRGMGGLGVRTGRRADNAHRPMTDERPHAIDRPFAFLCEDNYLTLNLFRAALAVPDRARYPRPMPPKTWNVATTSAASPSCGEDRGPERELTGPVPAGKDSPR